MNLFLLAALSAGLSAASPLASAGLSVASPLAASSLLASAGLSEARPSFPLVSSPSLSKAASYSAMDGGLALVYPFF